MKFIFLLIPSLIFLACDPFDKRLTFINNSENIIYIKISNVKNDSIFSNTMLGIGEVRRKGITKTKTISNWESEFEYILPDSILSILIFNENIEKIEDKENICNLMLKKGDYEYVNITINDLKKSDWTISVPNKKIKKGTPIKNIDSIGNIIY